MKAQNRKVSKAVDYINNNIENNLTIDTIAKSASLSRYHFIRLFKTITGSTPMQYVTKARIEHSKRLIRSTGLSLAIIAMTCGFASQSHFSKAFRAYTGTTPSQFRKAGYEQIK